MNKRSMKKGFPVRLLALLLCCFCLLSAIPTQVLATEEVTPPAQEEVTPAPAGNEGADASKDLTTENTSKTEEPKTEESKTEPPKTEEPKTEEPKTEEPKTEEPKTEESKTETPKTEEPKTEEPKTEEPEVEEPTLSLYDRIMACETVEEVNTILDNLTEEESQEMEQFTEEQQAALEVRLSELGFYDINDLAEAVQAGYNGNNMVAYDIMINRQGQNDSTKLVGIKLNGIDVPHGDSTKTWGTQYGGYAGYTLTNNSPGTGKKLSTYYGTNLTHNTPSEYRTLTITPAEGYYVTNVVIPCCNGGRPSQCDVWQNSSTIFQQPFTLATGRQVSIEVPSSAFGHYTSSNHASQDGKLQYFIMVVVAKIPTPTYVEYDYGDIVSLGGDAAIFNDADAWTAVTEGNAYGTTTEPDTNYTQYRYTYATGKPEDSKNWKHYANTVTATAKTNAASKGYYFAGWKAEYYTDCSANNRSNGKGGSYTYNFRNKYTEVSYGEGENVQIFAHVKLIAQWKPIELKVTKVVTGLEDGFLIDHDYTIQVQKQNGEAWDIYQEVTLTVNGNGTASQTLSPIQPGTYRAIETGGNGNLTGSTTIMYITVSDGGQVTYSTEEIKTSQELIVTNAYSPKPATQKLTIVKKITGNMQDPDKTFPFTVTVANTTGTMTMGTTSGQTLTFDLGKNQSAEIDVPVGATVTVTEQNGTYTYSYVADESDVSVTNHKTNPPGVVFVMPQKDCQVTFCNDKTVQIQTAVNMDFAPYVLLLTVVAFGALLLLRKRRVV